jgi:hypothetical protein
MAGLTGSYLTQRHGRDRRFLQSRFSANATCLRPIAAQSKRLSISRIARRTLPEVHSLATTDLVARRGERITTFDLASSARSESRRQPMNEQETQAFEYAERLLAVAIDVVGAAQVDIGVTWPREPKIIGLILLCRSISNFRAALVLVRENNVLEARILNRCLYENELWIAALRERGVNFIEEMRSDEAHARRSLAQLTLEVTGRQGANANDENGMLLRSVLNDLSRHFPKPRKLHADRTARQTVVELAYVEYARLSLDAVHCSLTALNRHVTVERSIPTQTAVTVNVEAQMMAGERLDTMLHLCRALMGVAIAANELLSFTPVSGRLTALVEEFERNGWVRGETVA